MDKPYKKKHMETYVNVTPIILKLESRGLSERQIKNWFKKNNPDRIIECEMYYEAINAGLPDPLQIPF